MLSYWVDAANWFKTDGFSLRHFLPTFQNVSQRQKYLLDSEWSWFATSNTDVFLCWTGDLALQKPELESIQPQLKCTYYMLCPAFWKIVRCNDMNVYYSQAVFWNSGTPAGKLPWPRTIFLWSPFSWNLFPFVERYSNGRELRSPLLPVLCRWARRRKWKTTSRRRRRALAWTSRVSSSSPCWWCWCCSLFTAPGWPAPPTPVPASCWLRTDREGESSGFRAHAWLDRWRQTSSMLFNSNIVLTSYGQGGWVLRVSHACMIRQVTTDKLHAFQLQHCADFLRTGRVSLEGFEHMHD